MSGTTVVRLGRGALVAAASAAFFLAGAETARPDAAWQLLDDPNTGVCSSREGAVPSHEPSYGWPVKPFHTPHPLRSFLGDPRIPTGYDGGSVAFHWGLDIATAAGTPVFSPLSGEAALLPGHPFGVKVVVGPQGRSFVFWHVRPLVRNGQPVVAYRTVIGRVVMGDVAAHVHFAEYSGGRFVNPLRPGAMGPYRDQTTPRIRSLRVERSGATLGATPYSGRYDLVVESYDDPQMAVLPPWDAKPMSPAVLRWRPAGTSAWNVSWDVREAMPPNREFREHYARYTRQNHPYGPPARYRFYLARRLPADVLAGHLAIDIDAKDVRGNATRCRFRLPGT